VFGPVDKKLQEQIKKFSKFNCLYLERQQHELSEWISPELIIALEKLKGTK